MYRICFHNNEGLSHNFKTHLGQKNDFHNWKELVEISKNVKFGKDRFTNCEDMNFQKSKFCMKTFVGGKSCLPA